MRNFTISLIIFGLSHIVQAEDKVCPAAENQPWDKMEESAFSKEASKKQLQALEKLFSGEIKVAEEFIHQSNLVLEGAYYRMEVDTWKDDPKNYKYAKERFCKFMAERAYLVH